MSPIDADPALPWHQRPGAPEAGTVLCRLADLADPGARGFLFGGGAARFDMFVVRRGGEVKGYVNECPHAFTPLETWPDRFLTRGGDQILCSTHGALFRIDDGLCTAGPCAGRALLPVPVMVADGMVVLG